MATDAASNKALVLEAFATLFDRRDFDAVEIAPPEPHVAIFTVAPAQAVAR